MKIPVGNFGYTVAQPAPLVDARAKYDALAKVAGAVAGVGLQRIAERKELLVARALNRGHDYRNAHRTLVESIGERLERGELTHETARAAFDAEERKIESPDVSDLDPVTAEHFAHFLKTARGNGIGRLEELVGVARKASDQRALVGGFDRLATAGTIAGANFPKLLAEADGIARNARAGGVPQESVTASYAKMREAIARSSATRDPRDALAKLATAESGDPVFDALTHEARQEVGEHARSQLVRDSANAVSVAYSTIGPEAATRVLGKLEASDLAPELLDDVRGQANEAIARIRTQRRLEHVEELTTLERRIAQGTAGREARGTLEDLYDLGALTPAELAGYHSQIDRNVMARAEQAAGARVIAEAVAQGTPLDPKNADHVKALTAAFDAATLGVQPAQPAGRAAAGMQAAERIVGVAAGSPPWQAIAQSFASELRMLPPQAQSWTRAALRSPDAKLAASAAQFYAAVQLTAPDALSTFDQTTKAMAGTIASMIDAGTAPERAVEHARQMVFDVKPELLTRRSTEYEQHVKANPGALAQLVDASFDPSVFVAQPAVTASLAVDFDAQASRYYARVGDISLARELAWQDLARVYGPTRVNGRHEVIAFPPERYGMTPEEIRTELGNFLKGNPQVDGSGSADVLLVPDGLTLRAVNDALTGLPVRPSYKLISKSGDLVVDRHGVPKRLSIPSGEALAQRFRAAADAAQAEAKGMVEQSRFDRATQRRRLEQLERGELR